MLIGYCISGNFCIFKFWYKQLLTFRYNVEFGDEKVPKVRVEKNMTRSELK